MQTFKIIHNPKKEWAKQLAKEVASRIISHGYLQGKGNTDYTIVIGGDGTLYYNRERLSGIVILIGSETSYRAQLTRTSWKRDLLKLMRSRRAVRLPLLELRAGKRVIARAMNDIVFHTSDHCVVNVEFAVGSRSQRFVGDGLIIATPFGSSGYSYSAGGRIFPLNSNKVCITPICPHLRAVKPRAGRFRNVSVSVSSNCALMADGMPVMNPHTSSFTVAYSENGPLYATAQRMKRLPK